MRADPRRRRALGVLSPLLVEVGKRWELLSVAQEHLLSEKIEHLLRAQLCALDPREGPLVLAACVDREDHVLGLLDVALRFARRPSRCLG